VTAADPLNAALAAEHAAIFGYGLVGARLTKREQTAAGQAEAIHRNRRDTLVVRITDAKATPAVAKPAYETPFEVTDRASALRLALSLEEGTGRAWHQALAGTTGDTRKMVVEALIDCATRATRWRLAAGRAPATVAFPGTS
jgi:hypothetical protein